MTVDELLANPAIDLPSGTIPLSAIILIEYANPPIPDDPQIPRLVVSANEGLTAWAAIGLLRYTLQRELNNVCLATTTDDDDT